MIEDLLLYCKPKGTLPDLVGSRSGALLIIGSETSVYDDLERYDHLHVGDRMLVDEIIISYPNQVEHIASLSVSRLWFWMKARPVDFKGEVHCGIRGGGFPENVWPFENEPKGSDLFAVIIALLMGYDSIVLAGVPVTNAPNIVGKPIEPQAMIRREQWEFLAQIWGDRVTSLSGWTFAQFGAPPNA